MPASAFQDPSKADEHHDVPSLPHQRDSASWLERTDENKTVFPSFHQDIQHPVNAVIEINVGRPSMISLDERARTRAHKAMASFIADRVVRFRLDYYPGARIPNSARTQRDHGHSPAGSR